jgi:hypothetical protein
MAADPARKAMIFQSQAAQTITLRKFLRDWA